MDCGIPQRRYVLVVDDDDGIRATLVFLLQGEGYHVDEAPDGKPALVRLRESHERMVVLLDLQMPGMDGLALLDAVAANEPLATRHAYILLTATPDRTLPLKTATLLTQLKVPVVAKPFDIDTLIEAVRQAEERLGPDR